MRLVSAVAEGIWVDIDGEEKFVRTASGGTHYKFSYVHPIFDWEDVLLPNYIFIGIT